MLEGFEEEGGPGVASKVLPFAHLLLPCVPATTTIKPIFAAPYLDTTFTYELAVNAPDLIFGSSRTAIPR